MEEKEYPVVLCYHHECEGELYAKNIRDALFGNIIEFVSGDNFYLEKEKSHSYQINCSQLKEHLKEMKDKISTYFTTKQLSVLKNLKNNELFACNTKFG